MIDPKLVEDEMLNDAFSSDSHEREQIDAVRDLLVQCAANSTDDTRRFDHLKRKFETVLDWEVGPEENRSSRGLSDGELYLLAAIQRVFRSMNV